MKQGSGRLGLWRVQVSWSRDLVCKVRFLKTGSEGEIPAVIRDYLAGMPVDPATELRSVACMEDAPYHRIYRAVREVPYGKTATYGEIADLTGTWPRVVGLAMSRNPTPIVIPCHRIISKKGIGGFTPDISIKTALLQIEGMNKSSIMAER